MPEDYIKANQLRFSVKQDSNRLTILDCTEFSATAGEFVGIVGPNGAGKTTLLKALAGLIKVEGEIKIKDRSGNLKPIDEYSPRERAKAVCYMHQDTYVPFAFTVQEVVAMGRQPWQGRFSSPYTADSKKVNEAMKKADCLDLSDRLIQSLSGGERQKVMLARALAQDTHIILLDEPTSSLDIGNAQNVFRVCRELADSGYCVIAVLHDLRQAASVCSRLCLLNEGKIIDNGNPYQVLNTDNIKKAYGVEAQIFKNPAGQWDYYIK
jgi:iron complex transport system ATP-binding protein